MKKKFTAVVPDRLYFPEISGNTKVSYTYDGPSTLQINITTPFSPHIVTSDLAIDEEDVVITLDANSNPQAAFLLSPNPLSAEQYLFEDETLSDGTIYKNRVNPSLHDYYKISYNTDTKQFVYAPIVRDWKTTNLQKAEEMKLSVQTGMLDRMNIDDGGADAVKQFLVDSGVDVGTLTAEQVVSTLQDFIVILDSYIAEESKIVTWKYENGPPETVFPEVPEIIKKFF